MGEAHGWGQEGRHVFDPVRLEEAAAELRQQNSDWDLRTQLQEALIPPAAFGQIPGAPEAQQRLRAVFDGMTQELGKLGIDIADLASRTKAAGNLARDVEFQTRAAAMHARKME